MPKYRKLYTKSVESLDINDMPDDFTRLFWVLMPVALCREGRGLDNAAWLKSKLFPLRLDVTQEMITDAMHWFEQRGMIVRYEVDSRRYFYVPTFHKYQGNTRKEAESDYPPPPDLVQSNSGATPELVQSKSGTDADADANAVFNIQYADADAEQSAEEAFQDLMDGKVNKFQIRELIKLRDTCQAHIDTLPRGSPGADLSGNTWLVDAITITGVKAQEPGLPYVTAIINDWCENGYQSPKDNGKKDGDRRRFIQGEYADHIEH